MKKVVEKCICLKTIIFLKKHHFPKNSKFDLTIK